jgi:hypothetical protein
MRFARPIAARKNSPPPTTHFLRLGTSAADQSDAGLNGGSRPSSEFVASRFALDHRLPEAIHQRAPQPFDRAVPIPAQPFTSVADLEAAIEDYLLRHNANPKPFVRTKTARVILEKERRALDLRDLIKTRYQAPESEH